MGVEVSVALTVRNEAGSIRETLSALASQTLKPAEVVVADGGSTDGTPELVEEFAGSSPVPVRLLRLPRCNRSVGRNAAVRATRCEIVAMTDGGCVADNRWLEELTSPFLWPNPPDVVAGYYEPIIEDIWDAAVGVALVPPPDEVDPENFLPSSRSIAFRKGAWRAVGGYPEHLSHNEDTPFALALRRAGFKFAFAPGAIVRWRVHKSPLRVFWQYLRYAYGDGEAGLFFRHYLKLGVYGLAGAALKVKALRAPALAVLSTYALKQLVHRWRRAREPVIALLSMVYIFALDAGQCVGYLSGWARRMASALTIPDEPLGIAPQIDENYNLSEGGRR